MSMIVVLNNIAVVALNEEMRIASGVIDANVCTAAKRTRLQFTGHWVAPMGER
jgi:hypothetical protein